MLEIQRRKEERESVEREMHQREVQRRIETGAKRVQDREIRQAFEESER